MILVDTGPLVAAANKNDKDHTSCVEFFRKCHKERVPLLVPGTVIAETCHLISRTTADPKPEADFLRLFARDLLVLVNFEPVDFDRMAELVMQYGDWPLGGTDASVVALAERLGVVDVATLDHRHFAAVRPKHVDAFNLLPVS